MYSLQALEPRAFDAPASDELMQRIAPVATDTLHASRNNVARHVFLSWKSSSTDAFRKQ